MRNIDYTTDRTYKSWEAMKSRCQNVMNPRYDDYGGRGVTVCERWQSFDNFLVDMGTRPENKSLGRLRNNAGYQKDNCTWQTAEEQQRNTRRNVLSKELVQRIKSAALLRAGSKRTLARKLAKETGLKFETIREVLKGRTWK